MKQYLVRAQVAVDDAGGTYEVGFEYRVEGVDIHEAQVAADDVIQAEMNVFGDAARLESIELEEL